MAGTNPASRGNRGTGFDKAVKQVAPFVRRLQAVDDMTIADIADALNANGVPSPTGSCWSYGTTRRVMRRAAQLGLGVRKRTLKSSRTFYRPAVPKWMGVNFVASVAAEGGASK